ncbi:MAG TPA: endonuclease/exonuclease/phosphatase family protein [Planctomycetota bacterium]|nr:endonuclease/exonuclease/phosphatase family protein [Planctomycetota bacterium]
MASAEPRARRLSLVGLSAAATWLALVSLGSSLIGQRWWWLLELPAHFLVQYAALFAIATLVLAFAHRWLTASLAAIACGVCVAFIAPLYVRDAPAATTAQLRVAFLNVHSGNRELVRVLAWLNAQDADVIVLAEVTDAVVAALAPLKASHPHVLIEPRPDNFGIALFSRVPLVDRRIVHHPGAEVPSAMVSVRVDGQIVRVIGTHPVPPVSAQYARWRDAQFADLAREITVSGRPTLVVGDLNCTSFVSAFSRFTAEAGLLDSRDGIGPCWSWPSWCPPLGIAIDHALASPSLRVAHRAVGPDLGSDHRAVTIGVALTPTP